MLISVYSHLIPALRIQPYSLLGSHSSARSRGLPAKHSRIDIERTLKTVFGHNGYQALVLSHAVVVAECHRLILEARKSHMSFLHIIFPPDQIAINIDASNAIAVAA